MKVAVKPEHHKTYILIITAILALIVSVYWGWVLFPVTMGNGEKTYQIETKTPQTPPSKPVSENKPVSVQTISSIAPDYSIPTETDGMAPVISTLPTKQNIVFLGIDDGAYKDQSVVDILKENHIKASLFLSKAFIASNPDFFKQLIDQGSVVEDHTLTHDTDMVNKEDYYQQKADICGMADYVELHYGHRPTLFRPPGGAYSDTMRRAAADCGMKAVVIWIAKANGGSMQYQIGDKLRPGDIVLLHFRPEFKQDIDAFVGELKASGLHTALLEDAIQ